MTRTVIMHPRKCSSRFRATASLREVLEKQREAIERLIVVAKIVGDPLPERLEYVIKYELLQSSELRSLIEARRA